MAEKLMKDDQQKPKEVPVKIKEPTAEPMKRQEGPKIDPKDKGKGILEEEPKKKKVKHMPREATEHDEAYARHLEEEELRAACEEGLIRVEVKEGVFVMMTKQQVAEWDEQNLKAQKEDDIVHLVKEINKQKAEDARAKRAAKPKTRAQLKAELVCRLRGCLPVNKLKAMSLESLQRMWDKDTFLNPEAKKRAEAEKKKKKKADKEKKKQEQLEQQLAKEAQWAREAEERKARMRQEYALIPDLPRKKIDLKDVIIAEPLNTELWKEDLPAIIDWTIEQYVVPKKHELIRIERADTSLSFWKGLKEALKLISREDLVRMFEIGTEKDLNEKKFDSLLESSTWNYISMIFEPERFPQVFSSFNRVKKWEYLANPNVHQITFDDGTLLFMLTDKEYEMSLGLMRSLIHNKLFAQLNNDRAEELVYMIMNRIHKMEEYERRHREARKNEKET